MSETIKVGDIVQVVKPARCGCKTNLGMTRTVTAFSKCIGQCVTCGDLNVFMAAVLDGSAPWSHWHIEPWRLKRIPPFPELADEKHEEDLHVPA